ncbi:phospholipase [Halovenus sp. WSH3]|uniref:Phospholipase n=1 Tax=Halovenus carboxidivorans TaxID=2692199 RepID=A0A6B0TAB3_9EURY|nr:phospholipase [Halovenus carboxidivorans]
MRWLGLVCCLVAVTASLVVAATPAAATQQTPQGNASAPEIVELYPDPATDQDAGEFLTITFPAGTEPDRIALVDEDRPVPLGRWLNGSRFHDRTRVTLSTDPEPTRRLTNRTVRRLPDRVQLANGGDEIRLLRNGTPIQRLSYDNATEAEVYGVRESDWQPLGGTDLPIATATGGSVETFVLPDEPTRAVEFLRSASERILLGGYTLSSQAVVDALVAAESRGVSVAVLLDGSPAGGTSDAAAAALTELRRSGVDVRVVDGARARYRFHHAKYAVVDERALVTTENWKPSGLGGRSSRGWAVITDQRAIVDGLTETFRADRGWVDAVRWSGTGADDGEATSHESPYPSSFEARSFEVERTELLVTPDNAGGRIRKLIDSADRRIRLKQVSIGSERFPLLRGVIDAARRGVEVEILLSGAWYVEKENERLRRRLTERAAAEDLPLRVRVADPGDRYEKIHAKGLIVDNETAVVGSINWNNNSLRRNREVALLIESDGVAGYFGRVFDADWEAAAPVERERSVPVGLAAAVVGAVVLAALAVRRIEFERD